MEVLVNPRDRRQWDVLASPELEECRLFPPETQKNPLVTTKIESVRPNHTLRQFFEFLARVFNSLSVRCTGVTKSLRTRGTGDGEDPGRYWERKKNRKPGTENTEGWVKNVLA